MLTAYLALKSTGKTSSSPPLCCPTPTSSLPLCCATPNPTGPPSAAASQFTLMFSQHSWGLLAWKMGTRAQSFQRCHDGMALAHSERISGVPPEHHVERWTSGLSRPRNLGLLLLGWSLGRRANPMGMYVVATRVYACAPMSVPVVLRTQHPVCIVTYFAWVGAPVPHAHGGRPEVSLQK